MWRSAEERKSHTQPQSKLLVSGSGHGQGMHVVGAMADGKKWRMEKSWCGDRVYASVAQGALQLAGLATWRMVAGSGWMRKAKDKVLALVWTQQAFVQQWTSADQCGEVRFLPKKLRCKIKLIALPTELIFFYN